MEDFDLDKPLINFANFQWSSRHAVEGVQIFGGIGSGKSSGSGRQLALKYLKAGFGGLVLTVKPDERREWQQYCELAGRAQDLTIIEPDGEYYFDFIGYESSSGKKSFTENVVEVLKTVINASQEKGGKSPGGDDFWEAALDQLLFHVIDLCLLSYGETSISLMYDITQSLPKPKKKDDNPKPSQAVGEPNAFKTAIDLAREKVEKKAKEWLNAQSASYLLSLSEQQRERAIIQGVPEARLLSYLHNFFYDSFINLAEKTRSVIEFSFSSFLFRLLRDPVYSIFCSNPTNVWPEDCEKGKIILIDLPVKIYNKIGRDCQIMFKFMWQRAMEKRQITKASRPVFLWADEAQHFLHEHDAEYQATARSSRIATVYISQNLPNYYANMGGEKGMFRVKSFLGTLSTKIFHANADVDTNEYASSLIGKTFFEKGSTTVSIGGHFSKSKATSLEIDHAIRPEQFVQLKTGGPKNDYIVEAYMHQQGASFKEGRNYIKLEFNQEYKPKTLTI